MGKRSCPVRKAKGRLTATPPDPLVSSLGPIKLTVYDPDGMPHEVAPVDAKEMVASGYYGWTPPIAEGEE
jgi:hypothetical protein